MKVSLASEVSLGRGGRGNWLESEAEDGERDNSVRPGSWSSEEE